LALGGRSIEEWQETLSYEEQETWLLFREKYGPMNPTIRTDAAIARLSACLIPKTSPKDFMPWPKEPEPEATLDDLMAILKASSKPKKERD